MTPLADQLSGLEGCHPPGPGRATPGSSGSRSSPATTGRSSPARERGWARWRGRGSCRRPCRARRPQVGLALPAGAPRAVADRPGPHSARPAGHRRHPQRHARHLQRWRPLRHRRRGAGPGATDCSPTGPRCSTSAASRPGRANEPVPEAEELRESLPVVEALARRHPGRSALGRHGQGGRGAGGARGRRRDRERRLRPSPRPRHGGAWSPRSGAGVVLMHSRGDGEHHGSRWITPSTLPDVVTAVRRSWARRWTGRSRPASAPDRRRARPRLRLRQDGGTEPGAAATGSRPSVSRPAAPRRALAQAVPRQRHRPGGRRRATPRPRRPACWPGSGAPGSSGCTTSRCTRDALAVAARGPGRADPEFPRRS